MDIKSVTKAVNQEIKKVKEIVTEWHAKRDEVFTDLKTVWQSQYKKIVEELKDNHDSKIIFAGLKDFEKYNNKTITIHSKKLLELNNEYSLKTKELSKGLGDLASPYLKTVKSSEFGTGVKAKGLVEQEVYNWIKNECFDEFDTRALAEKLNKKLLLATKGLGKGSGGEEDHKIYMAKFELFGSTMLNNFAEPLALSKATRKSLKDNDILSNMLYEVEISIYVQKIGQGLDDLKILNDSVHVDVLVDSYGIAPDEASLKRSKSAMKGVRESFAYFKDGFEESVLEDFGLDSMNVMYLNDMMDHLNLAKACFKDDKIAMNENYDMDTASRDLMSDSLHTYLNSDDFFTEVTIQKKAKKKVKP